MNIAYLADLMIRPVDWRAGLAVLIFALGGPCLRAQATDYTANTTITGTTTVTGATVSGGATVTVGSGGTLDSTGASSTYSIYVGGTVGTAGSGTLVVREGGDVIDYNGAIGYVADSTGAAYLTGSGSTWSNSNSLYVGYAGQGLLYVESGAMVSSTSSVYAGASSGSTGTITVTGTGSSLAVANSSSAFLQIGQGGHGELNISSGGAVTCYNANLGNGSGSTGAATMIGADSTWTITNAL